MKKALFSGNEAIARGAFEAGVAIGTGYPGTPSTEILENFSRYPGVATEWSVNEKVALEVAIGASLSGARTLVTMKHVGLNVAADPLFTASYIGIKGGLVVVNADDPDMHSSQNEQDNRHYAFAAKVPMLDPSDSREAKEFTKLAFELSERYDTPVLLRTTTRIAHAKSIVEESEPLPKRDVSGFERNVRKFVMIPAHARTRHVAVEERMRRLAGDANTLTVNRMEMGDTELGFITAGVSYQYVREVFPGASVLKLGMVNPLPEGLIREFCGKVRRVIVVEELDPFIEMRVRAMGVSVEGKKHFPLTGELTPDIVRAALKPGETAVPLKPSVSVPPRPPSLCPGCPHRSVFEIFKKLDLVVSGDIGCYTLGVLPPFQAMDTCVAMGASIGVLQGMEMAAGTEFARKSVAVIGDSTFAHSGVTGLINAAYNRRTSLIVVLDNGTTAMTGMQPNPFSGETISRRETVTVDYEKLAQSVGIGPENFKVVDACKPAAIEESVRGLLASGKLSLLIVKGLCIILRRKKK